MKYSHHTTRNGLRIIAVPMQNTETVTVLVLIGTGSNYEHPETNGLSHFLEHMFFKGTKKYPKVGELDRMLDAVGAIHNAFTSREETGYWVKVDAKHFPLALTFVSEILQNALLKKEEINRERGVILEEMNMYWDDPRRYVWSIFERLLYGDTSYGWDVIGTTKNIQNMPRETFLRYWKSQYVARNTVVVVAGNVQEEKVSARIDSAFAHLRSGKYEKEPLPPTEKQGSRVSIHKKDTAQTHIVLGAVGYPLEHDDRLVAEVLATILGGYMSSRLFMEIREKHGLAYTVRASHQAYKHVGYFAAYAGVPHKKAEEVVRRIVYNFEKVKKTGVTSEELTRAKDNIKGHLAISLESTDEVAAFVGEQEILLSKIRTPHDIIKKVERITKADIQRVARALFKKEHIYLALIGPHPREDVYKKVLNSF